MKKLLILLLVSLTFSQAQRIISVKENFYYLEHKAKPWQIKMLLKVFNKAKPYNLSWTASAIFWQESHLGEWKHNLADPSCGVFHQLLPDLADRYKITANMWNMSRLCDKLMDFEYAFKTFIETFRIKENICRNVGYRYKWSIWKCAVKAYNSYGNKTYYINIRNKIKALKIYLKRHKKN